VFGGESEERASEADTVFFWRERQSRERERASGLIAGENAEREKKERKEIPRFWLLESREREREWFDWREREKRGSHTFGKRATISWSFGSVGMIRHLHRGGRQFESGRGQISLLFVTKEAGKWAREVRGERREERGERREERGERREEGGPGPLATPFGDPLNFKPQV
jgi:hypothetical protein